MDFDILDSRNCASHSHRRTMLAGIKKRRGLATEAPASLARREGGFTLIELLGVLLIIAILAILLFPTMKSAMASAGAAKCAGNLKQIGVGIALYASDNNLKLPPGTEYTQKTNPDGSLGPIELGGDLGFPANYMDLGPKPWKTFACQTDRSKERWPNYQSYAQNYNFLAPYVNRSPRSGRWIRVDEARNKILFCDGITADEAAAWAGGWPRPNTNGNGCAGALLSQFANSTISSRHNGSVNALFGDGSVRFMRKSEACEARYIDLD